MHPGRVLFREVRHRRPDIYREIRRLIRPHPIGSVVRIFCDHLEKNVDDIGVFDRHRDRIPKFLLDFVRKIHKNIPSPGDAYGILLTCRITKTDTQDTLDSRHLREEASACGNVFNVEKDLRYELYIFSTQTQLLEIASRRVYSTVYVRDYSVRELLLLFPEESCHLRVQNPYNKGVDHEGRLQYLSTTTFIITEAFVPGYVRILYKTSKELVFLLRHLDGRKIVAFSDVKYVVARCGMICHFFNMRMLTKLQLFRSDSAVKGRTERDILNICKYQCRTGRPLPLNRDGLANHAKRSPLEVLSFEAPKKNYVLLSTGEKGRRKHPVKTSSDKIFFGQQFNEGTGYHFSIMNAS